MTRARQLSRAVPGRPRLDAARLASLTRRLTDRDREIAALLHEHRVLTTDQISLLLFEYPSAGSAARRRLVALHRVGIVDRFRPWTPAGSAPWHYVLGPVGAEILAAAGGTTPAGIGYQRDKALAVAHSTQLGHLLGVNSFYVALKTTARSGERELVTWWDEKRCTAQWGHLARPDAYGRWREDGREIDFFVEYDRGTERPASRVTGKLDGYARLAAATGIATPVLFWLPGRQREQGIRDLLPARCPVPVATAAGLLVPGEAGPAGPAWLCADSGGPRLRLADLAKVWAGEHESGHASA